MKFGVTPLPILDPENLDTKQTSAEMPRDTVICILGGSSASTVITAIKLSRVLMGDSISSGAHEALIYSPWEVAQDSRRYARTTAGLPT